MYKTVAALSVVLTTVFSGLYHLETLEPTPVGNAVIAEKPQTGVIGQAAILLPANLSLSQTQILNTAYQVAKADGHKNPEIVQQMILQESQAGGVDKFKVAGNHGDEYFGLSQLKIKAAKEVLNQYPALFTKYQFQTRTDDEIKANLIMNPVFNIEVGSKYLKILHDRYGYSGRTLLNAYNRGPEGVKSVDENFHYARGAEQKLVQWKRREASM